MYLKPQSFMAMTVKASIYCIYTAVQLRFVINMPLHFCEINWPFWPVYNEQKLSRRRINQYLPTFYNYLRSLWTYEKLCFSKNIREHEFWVSYSEKTIFYIDVFVETQVQGRLEWIFWLRSLFQLIFITSEYIFIVLWSFNHIAKTMT